jgi:hypothetical protein
LCSPDNDGQIGAASDPTAWASAHPDDVQLLVVMNVVGVERIGEGSAATNGSHHRADRIPVDGLAASLAAGATGSISFYASPDEVVLAIESGNVRERHCADDDRPFHGQDCLRKMYVRL